jgi:hypothetical protein
MQLSRSCVLPDATAHSEQGVLIRCDIAAKPAERSELECLMWWITFREHMFIDRVQN